MNLAAGDGDIHVVDFQVLAHRSTSPCKRIDAIWRKENCHDVLSCDLLMFRRQVGQRVTCLNA